MSDGKSDITLTVQATKRLAKLRPGLVCPFCHSEDSFIHHQRQEPISYAFNLYDHDQKDLQSAYSIDLISCMVCGYTMTFLPSALEKYLASLEEKQKPGHMEGEDANHS